MLDYYWQKSLPTPLHINYIRQILCKLEYADPEENMVKVTSTNLHLKITEDCAQSKPYMNFCPTLLRNIVHLDNVIKALICPSIGLKENDIPTHHCPSFEEFLVTEYLIGQHDPELSSKMDWDSYTKQIPACFVGEKYNWEVDSVPKEDFPKMWDEVVKWYSQELDPHWISQWARWDEGLGVNDEEEGTDAGGLGGDIDLENMGDVDQDMEHGDDFNPEISGSKNHGGEGDNWGKGCNENEDSEGSNNVGQNEGGGEWDSNVPTPPNQASLAVTQKQQLSEGSDKEEGGQPNRPSPNPPAASPNGEAHWSLSLDLEMIESQVDFPLESFSQGASIVNEGLDPTPFPVAEGDDEMTTHGDIPHVADGPPLNQQSGRGPGGKQKGKGVETKKEFITRQFLQSQKSMGTPQTVLAHDFDMITMTVSPRKCTIARTLPQGMQEVSLTLGPSNITQPLALTNTQTQITLDSEEVAMFLKMIPGVV
ncbi:hypothetical protein BKA82DRAFT_4020178 [Pisolithus tinctorius]|nr:hypothetical protein BKA82DRAFT_4020178 [Pisolithus tinctorius]